MVVKTCHNSQNETQRMTSLEIAEISGKQHKHVMEAIRKMEPIWKNIAGSNFRLGSYLDPNNQQRPCYLLTKTETLYIATKFNDEARARLVIRWEQLEQERLTRMQQESSRHNAVRKLLVSDSDVLIEAEHIVGERLDRFNEPADDCINISDIAAVYNMDPRDLNSFLVDMNVQRWAGGQYRLTSQYEGRGYTEDRLFIYYSRDGKQKSRTYLVWTEKGREFINKLINH